MKNHFIYSYMASSIIIVKDHSEGGNPLSSTHGLLMQGIFHMHHPTDRILHDMAFVTPVVEYWLEWEMVQWIHHEVFIWLTSTHHERMLYHRATFGS